MKIGERGLVELVLQPGEVRSCVIQYTVLAGMTTLIILVGTVCENIGPLVQRDIPALDADTSKDG